MDDLAGVHILDCLAQLVDIVSCLDLVESLAALDEVRKRLILADVEHDVDILTVLKIPIESHYVFIVERSMNLDLTGQLLTSLGSCQVCFWDNFECPSLCLVLVRLDWLNPLHLVALGKSSLSQTSTKLV